MLKGQRCIEINEKYLEECNGFPDLEEDTMEDLSLIQC
jgi:hypothetical protein